MPKNREAPEFALLKSTTKTLIRKLGNTDSHEIKVADGQPGKGWTDAEDMGWVFVRVGLYGGYTVTFTLNGWERWCCQVDVDEGMDPKDLPEPEFE